MTHAGRGRPGRHRAPARCRASPARGPVWAACCPRRAPVRTPPASRPSSTRRRSSPATATRWPSSPTAPPELGHRPRAKWNPGTGLFEYLDTVTMIGARARPVAASTGPDGNIYVVFQDAGTVQRIALAESNTPLVRTVGTTANGRRAEGVTAGRDAERHDRGLRRRGLPDHAAAAEPGQPADGDRGLQPRRRVDRRDVLRPRSRPPVRRHGERDHGRRGLRAPLHDPTEAGGAPSG